MLKDDDSNLVLAEGSHQLAKPGQKKKESSRVKPLTNTYYGQKFPGQYSAMTNA